MDVMAAGRVKMPKIGFGGLSMRGDGLQGLCKAILARCKGIKNGRKSA